MSKQSKPLNEYRRTLYLTVEEFAHHLDVAADTTYRIQRGEQPRLSTMRKIASKLGVHPTEIEEFVPKDEARLSDR